NLDQHGIKCASGLADVDHLAHHRREYATFRERSGESLPFTNALACIKYRLLDHFVASRSASDEERVEYWHARREQRAESASEARHCGFAKKIAEDRELEQHAINGKSTFLGAIAHAQAEDEADRRSDDVARICDRDIADIDGNLRG